MINPGALAVTTEVGSIRFCWEYHLTWERSDALWTKSKIE
jgi:hypothetical protein